MQTLRLTPVDVFQPEREKRVHQHVPPQALSVMRYGGSELVAFLSVFKQLPLFSPESLRERKRKDIKRREHRETQSTAGIKFWIPDYPSHKCYG